VFFLELREILSGDSFTINIYYEKGVIINEFEGLIVEVVLFHIDQVLILLVVNVFFFFYFYFFFFFFFYFFFTISFKKITLKELLLIGIALVRKYIRLINMKH